MIKVYFGPFKHSPAGELGLDERRLWFSDFGLLKGYDQDFWTNNPVVLDMFQPDQIHVWQGHWIALSAAADELMPERYANEKLRQLPPGRLAMACELLWYQKCRDESDRPPQTS